MAKHYRITLTDALEAHGSALTYGGAPGILNLGSVQSAIARPYSGYHVRIFQKAAALVHSMARNHGFADGNKRTTIILMYMLLGRSGYRLDAADQNENIVNATEEMVLDVVNGELGMVDLTEWFRLRIAKII